MLNYAGLVKQHRLRTQVIKMLRIKHGLIFLMLQGTYAHMLRIRKLLFLVEANPNRLLSTGRKLKEYLSPLHRLQTWWHNFETSSISIFAFDGCQ